MYTQAIPLYEVRLRNKHGKRLSKRRSKKKMKKMMTRAISEPGRSVLLFDSDGVFTAAFS